MKSDEVKMGIFAAAKLKAISLITTTALAAVIGFSACDDSGSIAGGNKQTFIPGGLTIFLNHNFSEDEDEFFIFAKGVNAGENALIAAAAITGNNITCARTSGYYATLNVWEEKEGTFVSYSGSGIAHLTVFIISKSGLSYNEIKALNYGDEDEGDETVKFSGLAGVSFTSGIGKINYIEWYDDYF